MYCSDTSGELLYPVEDSNYKDDDNRNPGAKHLVSASEIINQTVSGAGVLSATLHEIFEFGRSHTYILKVDIEGFDCNVRTFKTYVSIYENISPRLC